MDDTEYLAFATAGVREEALRGTPNAPPELLVALDHLLPHVFERDADFDALRLELGAEARQAFDEFAGNKWDPLSGYFDYLRFFAAMRLMEHTSLPFRRIGELLGYRPWAFKMECRMFLDFDSPGETRREARLRGEAQLEAPKPMLVISPYREWGDKPAPSEDFGPVLPGPLDARLSRQLVERTIERCEDRLEPLRKMLTTPLVCCGRRTLFDLLARRSRQVAWLRPAVGLEIAELALGAVEGSFLYLGPLGPELRVLAMGWLGFLHSSCGHQREAQRWLRRAERAISRPFRRYDPVVESEARILWLRGALRQYAGDLAAAEELLGQAVEIAAAEEDEEAEVEALAQRVEVLCRARRWQEARRDLGRVIELLETARVLDFERLFWTYRRSAEVAIEAGAVAEAKLSLEVALIYSKVLGGSVGTLELSWLGGQIARAEGDDVAEGLFREAWDGLAKSWDVVRTALVGIDLAILLEEEGRGEEAAVFVECEVVRVLDRVVLLGQACREAIDALRPGFEEGVLPAGALRAARDALRERQMR